MPTLSKLSLKLREESRFASAYGMEPLLPPHLAGGLQRMQLDVSWKHEDLQVWRRVFGIQDRPGVVEIADLGYLNPDE